MDEGFVSALPAVGLFNEVSWWPVLDYYFFVIFVSFLSAFYSIIIRNVFMLFSCARRRGFLSMFENSLEQDFPGLAGVK